MAYPAKAQWAGIVKWLVEEGAESERNDILKQIADIRFDTSRLNKLNNEAYKNKIITPGTNLNNQGTQNIYNLIETEIKAKSYSFLNKTNNMRLAELGAKSVYNKFYAYIDSLKERCRFYSFKEVLDGNLITQIEELDIEGVKDTLLYDINRNRKIALLLNRYPEILQVYSNSFSSNMRTMPEHLLYWGVTADSHRGLFPKSYIIEGKDVKFESTNNISNIVYNNNIIGRITSETDIECENIDLLNLIPNSEKRYKIGNSLYETDKLGRVINVYAQIQKSDKGKSKLKNQLKIKSILAAKQSGIDEMALYLLPKEYGGTSSYLNIVSVLKNNDNKKAVKSCLKYLKQELKQHGYVSFSASLHYCNASPYPNTIKLNVTKNTWSIFNGLKGEVPFIPKKKNEIKEKEINYTKKLLYFQDKTPNINIEEQEADLHISNSERQNPSPLIILPRQIHCKGDMAGFPITMDILLDETGNITGQYKNIRYGTEMEIKGKQENDGILNMTLNNRKETVLMKLSQTSGNTLEGYAEGGSKQLKVHMNILSNEKSANNIMLKGMINDKYRIVMQIYMDVKNVSGSYYYVKNGSNNTLELSGSKNSNDYMLLKEYNSAGENTGTFEGKWSMDSYSGTFTNYKGIKMPFKLYRETTATNNSDITFNSYQNSRFNYTITYPSFLTQSQESENGDGCKFYMDDNTYLVVSGAYNALDESIVSRYYKCKSKPVTYSMQKDNWFVISNYTSNGNIFYTKTVLQNGVFFTATFYYPAKDKDKYNPVIKKIFTNFPLISDISSISNSLSSFFRKNIGKYPSDINLLEFPLLKTRLIALVGNNNYNFIKTYFQVVTPIKLGFNKNPNLYEMTVSEAHNAGYNDITIVYNQQLDNLTVQLIKEGSDPLIFQEKKDDSPFE